MMMFLLHPTSLCRLFIQAVGDHEPSFRLDHAIQDRAAWAELEIIPLNEENSDTVPMASEPASSCRTAHYVAPLCNYDHATRMFRLQLYDLQHGYVICTKTLCETVPMTSLLGKQSSILKLLQNFTHHIIFWLR